MSRFVDDITDIEALRRLYYARVKQSQQYVTELRALRSTGSPDKVRLLELIDKLNKSITSINNAFDRAYDQAKSKGWKDVDVQMLLMWLGHEQNRTVFYMQSVLMADIRNAIAGLPEGTTQPKLPDVST